MTHTIAQGMAINAIRYLRSLSRDDLLASQFRFNREHRTLWEFEPLGAGNPRYGVPWPALTPIQQNTARDLLRASLSPEGLEKAETIRDIDVLQHPHHGTRSYSLWFYGDPALGDPWAWRFEGHHLSVTFTICGDAVSNTPLFVGVSPTRVNNNTTNPQIPLGTRAMAAEEDLSHALWGSLDATQRKFSTITLPPMSMRTPQVARVERKPPQGIWVGELRPEQRALVQHIVRTFVGNVTPELADIRYREIESAKLDEIVLSTAWASAQCLPRGHARPGGIYYRLQGPTFLFEYDDVQWGWQNTGHIHTVWRNFDDDFGFRTVHR
jgi:hypothetical protein